MGESDGIMNNDRVINSDNDDKIKIYDEYTIVFFKIITLIFCMNARLKNAPNLRTPS